MPIFKITGQTLSVVEQTNFSFEKELQGLVEKNLETLFGCRFVASEFSTGSEHAGRIDTLALSEENSPVIIEYKKVASSSLITQSLFYLNWICMEIKNRDVKLFVKLDPKALQNPPATFRDVSSIGHYGTGDCEFTLTNLEEFEEVKPIIEMAYNKLGG